MMADEDRRRPEVADDRCVVVDDLGDAELAEARIRSALQVLDAVVEEGPRWRDGLVAAGLEALHPRTPRLRRHERAVDEDDGLHSSVFEIFNARP